MRKQFGKDSRCGYNSGRLSMFIDDKITTGSLPRTFLALLFLASASVCAMAQSATASATITSPDQRLQIQFATIRDGQAAEASGTLVYNVKYNGKPLVNDSGLSLDLEGQPPLGADVHVAQTTPSSGVDDYAMMAGKRVMCTMPTTALRSR